MRSRLALALLLLAAPFWEAKAPAQWTDIELRQMLVDSPWAQLIPGPTKSFSPVQAYLATAAPVRQAEEEIARRANRQGVSEFRLWFDEFNATGDPTNQPPPIKSVIKMLVPAVDSDGNELGGVPTVLRDAPLGTYLGWNITSAGFHVGQVCNYVGGMVPFAVTKAERQASKDPRPSLEERYGTHDGYVAAVRSAADNAACQGYLFAGAQAAAMGAACTTALQPGVADDWAALVTQAMNSNVLK